VLRMATAREVIRDMRKEQKLSIRELARLADVDHTYLSRYERGLTAEPSARWLRDVTQALGRNLADIQKASA
jgi:transcriptional regulator with XRE-family HTH domain